jgi:tetratricopeptide (TPR) repeat protein
MAAAYNNRAYVYDAKEDHNRTIADFDKAIALDPKLVVAYAGRGSAYFANGLCRRGQGFHALFRAWWCGDVWIYRKRAEAYEKLGDNSRADADYDKAAALKLAAKGASGWLGVSLASLTEDEAKGQAGLRRACPYGA